VTCLLVLLWACTAALAQLHGGQNETDGHAPRPNCPGKGRCAASDVRELPDDELEHLAATLRR